MVTLGGAQAAGLSHLIGSLEVGKRADIVIRSRDVAELMPSIDPVHQLVTVGSGPSADTVLVNGRVVLCGGRTTRVDDTELFAKARASVAQVIKRLGLKPPGLWPRAEGG
jgi:5-methylthioadenosine/S-adenosylhomocysteine deaminase